MTIATTTNKVIGQGNGATTNWPFKFLIPDAASLQVIYTDANGALTVLNSAQYSVAGLADPNGGSVTYPLAGTPIALGTTLTVLRSVAYVQQSSVRNQSGFFPDVYEDALDYLTMQTQQLQEITGRCAQIASTVSGVTMTMPTPLAGSSIGWNSTATGLANIVLAGTIAIPVGINQGGTGQTTKATGAAALGLVQLITAAGTANAQTANAPANYAAFALNDLLEYTPAVTNTGATTLTVTPAGGGALAAKNVFAGGAALVGAELISGVPTLLQFDGVQLNILGKSPWADKQFGYNLVGGYLEWTVAGNVLTCAVKTWAGNDPSATAPVFYAVRDVTPATGSLTYRPIVAALSATLNNTALAGTANATAFRLWGVIFNDAGVDRLSLINCLTTSANAGSGRNADVIYPLAGWGIASAVLSDNAADNAQVFYANAAIASKAYTTIGYATWETGLAAAGVWSAGPTRKQLFGPGVPLPGHRIQAQRTNFGAVATGATGFAFADAIAANTIGDQYLTQAIVPTSAANVLDIEAQLLVSTGATRLQGAALFQDATVNALTQVYAGISSTADWPNTMVLRQRILSGVSVSTTFKTRTGNTAAALTTLNGAGAGRIGGGNAQSFICVEEIMA